jgi:hypothetical protein
MSAIKRPHFGGVLKVGECFSSGIKGLLRTVRGGWLIFAPKLRAYLARHRRGAPAALT